MAEFQQLINIYNDLNMDNPEPLKKRANRKGIDREVAKRMAKRKWYLENKARVVAQAAAYNKAHPEKHAEQMRAYRQANKERLDNRSREYQKLHKEQHRVYMHNWYIRKKANNLVVDLS